MQPLQFAVIALVATTLVACKGPEGSENSGLACQTVRQSATALHFSESSGGVDFDLDINLINGAAQLRYVSATEQLDCSHNMSAIELNELNRILASGVSYCGPSSQNAKLLRLSYNTREDFSLSLPSAQTVTIQGGYSAFEADLKSFVTEIRAQGVCTGVRAGNTEVGGEEVPQNPEIPNFEI